MNNIATTMAIITIDEMMAAMTMTAVILMVSKSNGNIFVIEFIQVAPKTHTIRGSLFILVRIMYHWFYNRPNNYME